MPITRYTDYKLSFDGGYSIGDIYYGGAIFEKPLDFPSGITYWTFGTVDGQNIPADSGMWFQSPMTTYDLYSGKASGAGVMYKNEYGYDISWYFDNWGKNQIGADTWDFLVSYAHDNFYWIWGDVYSGLAIARVPGVSNRFVFFATYGLYENPDNGDLKIACETSNEFNVEQLTEGCFSWYTNVWAKNGNDFDGASYGGVWWVCKNTGWSGNAIQTNSYAMTDYGHGWILYGTTNGVSMGDTLVDGFASSTLGGAFPNLVITLNSVNSPYTGTGDVYEPHVITGWNLIAGGPFAGATTTSADASHTPSSSAGGGGSYDLWSDPIGSADADQFTIDALNSGFLTVFNPTKSEIIDFASFLYSNSITDAIANQLKHLIADPLDYIVGLNMAHFTPVVSSTSTINFGGVSSGITSAVVSPQMQFLDCGTISIPEQTNSFQDYEMSTVSLYLPYCGIHELDNREVMGGTIQVKYIIDCLTGSCVADVIVTKSMKHMGESDLNSILYTFTGNCFQAVPLTSRDFKSTISGLLGVASSAGTFGAGMATGNLMAMASGVSGAINGAMNSTPNVSRVGNYSSNYGYMQAQKPYVILTRPIASIPSLYEDYYGRPLYSLEKLDTCEGYVEIDPGTLWTGKFDFITSEEEEMLQQIVGSGGIYIDHTSEYYNYNPEE